MDIWDYPALKRNAEEIRAVQKEINNTDSPYRRRDLGKRLKKLRKERAEAVRWLRKAGKIDDKERI